MDHASVLAEKNQRNKVKKNTPKRSQPITGRSLARSHKTWARVAQGPIGELEFDKFWDGDQNPRIWHWWALGQEAGNSAKVVNSNLIDFRRLAKFWNLAMECPRQEGVNSDNVFNLILLGLGRVA